MFLFVPRSLCALKRIVSKYEGRYSGTQGIRFASKAGMYRVEATDGHRAIIVQGQVAGQDPPWPGFKAMADDAFEAIILPKDFAAPEKND